GVDQVADLVADGLLPSGQAVDVGVDTRIPGVGHGSFTLGHPMAGGRGTGPQRRGHPCPRAGPGAAFSSTTALTSPGCSASRARARQAGQAAWARLAVPAGLPLRTSQNAIAPSMSTPAAASAGPVATCSTCRAAAPRK